MMPWQKNGKQANKLINYKNPVNVDQQCKAGVWMLLKNNI